MKKTNSKITQYVYGLDIGTRSIVGTVGYRNKDRFVVVAQQVKEHESRAMIDGQIHDIGMVSDTIREVTNLLEERIGESLHQVCIAAAGRVLKTVTVHAELDLEGEKVVSAEDIHTLDSYGIEKAYEIFQKENDSDMKFYCVGYSVMRYYMNGYLMSNLENHKAKEISADMIATFLPDDVVDGLYKAVELAGLEVANLTLEPIAAIELAIPEMYRMLNIALIDVGAGTSDISITKDGSIAAYGMLPVAGDCLTEDIARHCLVDFQTAEQIKKGIETRDEVEYKDIMGISQKISSAEVLSVIESNLENMASMAADKIKELNGNKPVSAVFVVGGGGKIATYTQKVAKHLGIASERCAVRGEEVMAKIDFMERDALKDSLMVTPIGICLNYYEQSNNFIFVTFNDKRIKLYDNNRLAIVDAAILAEFSNDDLFPKRGEPLEFILNGKAVTIRGSRGESAKVILNGEEADIHTAIRANDIIRVIPSTAGEKAAMEVSRLPEYAGSLTVHLDGTDICVPKLASVNGELQSAYYQIQNGDRVELLNYYTVSQILEFMDIDAKDIRQVMVNHENVDLSAKVYDNFTVAVHIEEQNTEEEPETEKQNALAQEDGAREVAVPKKLSEDDSTEERRPSALEKAKEDAQKVMQQLEYERAEEGLARMIQAAVTGVSPLNNMTVQEENLHIEKSSRELYGSIQEHLKRLKEGTPVKKLREEVLAQSVQNVSETKNAVIRTEMTADTQTAMETEKDAATQKVQDVQNVEEAVAVPPMSVEMADGRQLQILHVIVNGALVTLRGKPDYIYVDVFQYIDFDLSRPQGKSVETLINGRKAQYTEPLTNGDRLDIFWKD